MNSENNSLVLVEGVRDARALRACGFHGDILMLCHRPRTTKLEDRCSKFDKTIFLLDNDAEGKRLVERTQRLLRGKTILDTHYQKALLPAGKGKIRHVEELSRYAEKVALAVSRI
ncbi:MAG: toprim domain-containing protein [Nitrososphaerota archaeon]|nr:toprim domain-containing protein [Nitrososphaerota archaeon]